MSHEPIITLGDNAPAFLRKAAEIWNNKKNIENKNQDNNTDRHAHLKSCAGYIPKDLTEPIWNSHLQVYKKAHINASQEGYTNMIINDTRITEHCFQKAELLGITDPEEKLCFKDQVIEQFLMFFDDFYDKHLEVMDCVQHMKHNNMEFLSQNFETALSLSMQRKQQ